MEFKAAGTGPLLLRTRQARRVRDCRGDAMRRPHKGPDCEHAAHTERLHFDGKHAAPRSRL